MRLQVGQKREQAAYLAALLVVGLMALWASRPHFDGCLRDWNHPPPPSWTGALPQDARPGERICDIDTRLIMGGLTQAPRLPETVRWWTGTWAGQVPFYRPLTSYVFWAEWRAWGNYEPRYNFVAALIHLAAVLSLVRLARIALAYFRLPHPTAGALLAGILFVQGWELLPAQETVTALTFSMWKNQPDSLTLLFFSLSLSAYLQNLEGGPRSRWQTVAPVFWYTLVCLTKEAGVFLPLLLLIVESGALRQPGTRRAARHRLLPMACLLPLYLGLRTVFLRDALGYRYGSNEAWSFRLWSNVAGSLSQAAAHHDWIALGVAVVIVASFGWAFLLSRRGSPYTVIQMSLPNLLGRSAGPLVALLAVGVALAAYRVQERGGDFNLPEALVTLFLPQYLIRGAGAACWLLCAGRALWQRPRFGALFYVWGLLTLGLTLFSPSPLHRYYLMNAGYAVLLAGGAMLWVAPLVARLSFRSSPLGTTSAAAPTAGMAAVAEGMGNG